MTEPTEHRDRWQDDLAAYSIDALDERESFLVERHLEECDACAEQLRWLAPAVNVLPATVVQRVPPPELRERLMAIVTEEAAAAKSPERAVAPVGERRRRWLPSFEGMTLRPALAGVATFLLLVAGVTGYALRDGSATDPKRTVPARGAQPSALASGSLQVDGDSGVLHVRNLPPTGDGEVYQAWVQDARGSIHPSSVFVLAKDGTGNVAIPHGLEGAQQVMVTREGEGGSDKPHENPLITAPVS